MPKLLLTDLSIRALKPESRTDFWDTKTPAFGVRVGKTSKTFIVKKENRRLTIGRFGDWTLQKAREEAKRLLLQKSSGTRITVAAALDLFVESHLKARNRASTQKEHERILRKHLKPMFEKRIGDISKADFLALLRPLQRTPSAANHLFVVARIFFRWAMKNDHIQQTPLAALTLPHRQRKRTRVLSDQELQLIWRACECKPRDDGPAVPHHFATIVKLLILTGQRRGEIAALQANFFKDDVCTLPDTLTKNGREHSFPLGLTACAILKDELMCSPEALSTQRLLFPARGKNSKPFNGWSKSKAALDKLSGVTGWTLHDLRRTFRTIHARIGTPPHIAERLLNHVNAVASDVEQIYDLHTYIPEMRKAVGAYETHLAALFEPSREAKAA